MQGDIVHRANQAITEWSQDTDKLVVGIDGYPGVGKSTLADDLQQINADIFLVCRDDFVIERSAFEQILQSAQDKTKPFELDMLDVPRFRRFISDYKSSSEPRTNVGYNRITGKIDVEKTYDFSKPILLIEGIFLFHAELTDDLFDRRIFLQGNLEQIAQRRVAREKARWGKEYFPEDHPDSYFRLVMQAYDRYIDSQHPDARADLIIHIT